MKGTNLCLWLVVLLCLCLNLLVQTAVSANKWSWEMSLSFTGNVQGSGTLVLFRHVIKGTPWANLFEGTPLVENVGKTIWITSNSDDPDYTNAVAGLTNGVNNSIDTAVWVGGNGGSGYETSESGFGISPDFVGYTIRRIGCRVDYASTAYTAPWTHFDAGLTFIVDVVPEPSSLLAIIGGLAGLGLVRRRRI